MWYPFFAILWLKFANLQQLKKKLQQNILTISISSSCYLFGLASLVIFCTLLKSEIFAMKFTEEQNIYCKLSQQAYQILLKRNSTKTASQKYAQKRKDQTDCDIFF